MTRLSHVPTLTAFLLVLLGCDSKHVFPWNEVSFAQAQKSAGEKMIMIDFFAEG